MSVTASTAARYTNADPDVRLMLRVRDDDAGAFETLVRNYQSRVERLMRQIAPDASAAEDLTQDVFLRIFRSRKRYEPGAKFSTWLFTIAGNVARNAHRSASRRHEYAETDSPHLANGDASGLYGVTQLAVERSALMPARRMEADEQIARVQAAVERLPERQRVAMVLSRFEHLSYQEIADSMGLTTKAVKSLLSRARVSLRDALAGEQP